MSHSIPKNVQQMYIYRYIQYFIWGKLDHSLATNLFGTHWKSAKPLDSTRNEGTSLGHEIVYQELIKI